MAILCERGLNVDSQPRQLVLHTTALLWDCSLMPMPSEDRYAVAAKGIYGSDVLIFAQPMEHHPIFGTRTSMGCSFRNRPRLSRRVS